MIFLCKYYAFGIIFNVKNKKITKFKHIHKTMRKVSLLLILDIILIWISFKKLTIKFWFNYDKIAESLIESVSNF